MRFTTNSAAPQNPRPSNPKITYVHFEVTGIPAHLCSKNTVAKLLGDTFQIDHATFLHYTCFVEGHTTTNPEDITYNATLGVKKTTQGNLLAVWPVWYKFMESPSYNEEPESPQLLVHAAEDEDIRCSDQVPADYGKHEGDFSPIDSSGYMSGCSHHTECMCRYKLSD